MRNILTLAAAWLLIAGCGGLVQVGAARGSMITQTEDPQQVRGAIARALAARRYTVETEQDGVIVARLDHRSIMVRLRIEYSGADYRIGYVDSAGLDYRVDPASQRPMISRRYPRYVSILERVIRQELDRPAREAREAVEAQQEHELALQEERSDREAEARRDTRREARDQRSAAAEQERQQTERERLRTEAARAEADRASAQADAEYQRRQPLPRITQHEPVVVQRMAFEPAEVQSDSVDLQPGFMPDPFTLNGRAAGRTSSRRLGLPSACPGHWTRQPQHYVTLPQGLSFLRMDVLANTDTTLAVVTPDGQVWCDDDGGDGHNPRLHGVFPAGTYAVYVGTYERGRRTNYSVQLSERRAAEPRAPRHQRGNERATEQAPNCRQVLLDAGHHPNFLNQCEGVEPYCAQALLQGGHHPNFLSQCRGVDRTCAVSLLSNGRHPNHLSNCH